MNIQPFAFPSAFKPTIEKIIAPVLKRIIALLLLLFASFSTFGDNLISHQDIKNQRNCFSGGFTSYETWRGLMTKKYQKRAKTEKELSKKLTWFDALFGKENFDKFNQSLDCQVYEYQVDSQMVKGFVIKPKVSKEKLPVLVYNRGGNGNFGSVVLGSMMHNLFPIAAEGFVIIGSQYRGTHTNSSATDEFGGKDVKDVVTLLNYISEIADADSDRIGMFGASRGGMQTHLAVQQTDKVKAIATLAGNTDLSKGLTYRAEMEKVYKKRIPNYLENKQAELDKRSVLKWVDKLSPDVPILLLHGTADKRVSVKHSEDFAAELSKHGIPHKLVLYANDDHMLKLNRENANRELVQWFKKYL